MTGAVRKRDYSLESPDNKPPSIDVEGIIHSPSAEDVAKGQEEGSTEESKKGLMQVLKSKCFLCVVVICVILLTLLCVGLVATFESDNDVTATVDVWNDKLSAEQLFWFENGLDELRQALGVSSNTRQAKNVILFVADGMGPSTVTAARIYKAKEEGHLTWERFPHMGMLKVLLSFTAEPEAKANPSLADLLCGQTGARFAVHGYCVVRRRQEQLRDRWRGLECGTE